MHLRGADIVAPHERLARRGAALLAFAACGLSSSEARADDSAPSKSEYRVGLFESVGTNMLDSVTGYNLLFHGAAIASTVALSASGADDAIQRWFWRDNAILGDVVPRVAFIGGWFTPVIIPGAVALTGIVADDGKAASAGVAALQAVGINAIYTQLAKWITARPLPYKNGEPSEEPVSISRSDDGRKWGDYGRWVVVGGGVAWPSGHTSSHMALASSLVAFYRDVKWLPFVAYPLVAVMGLSMIEGDHHWFSDVVAGALVGHAIGWTVGSNMRRKYDAANGKGLEDPSTVQVQPVVSSNTFMLVLSL